MVAKKSTDKRERYLIQAELPTQEDQDRFEKLLAASGFPRAEYIRRCCLNKEIKVIPQEHLDLYAQLGEVQVAMTAVREVFRSKAEKENGGQGNVLPTPIEDTLALINTRIEEIKELRASLLGIDLENPEPNH